MLCKNLVNWDNVKIRLTRLIYGEYFTDALRNTATVVLPVVLLFFNHQAHAAIGVGVGALLISLTDVPGNKTNKFKSAVACIITFSLTAFLISSSLHHPWLTASGIFLLSFIFSMLAIFGYRFALMGTMALILAIFTLGLHPEDPLLFSWYIFIGGSWYYLISLLQIIILPYRSLHQAIFECITSTAAFLKSKANCYNADIPLEECYQENIALHIKVSEKQELIRELLLSDKTAMKPTNERGQQLLRTAISVIDLYEQVTAIHYDYAFVRKALSKTGALNLIIELIEILAEEMNVLSGTFLRPSRKAQQSLRLIKFEQIKTSLRNYAISENETNASILLKVLKNLEDIDLHIQVIRKDQPISAIHPDLKWNDIAYEDFLPPQLLKPGSLKQHFSFSSPIFRFSLRLAFLCLGAYLITFLFPYGKYSYWMLLTIVIVAKPRFGLTWKRNIERLSGTFIGAILGLVLLLIIRQESLLLSLSTFFLLGFFTFNRIKYVVSVICITAMVILCLSIYSGHADYIITERIGYTIAGCAMAFLAAFLFPIWELKGLKSLISNILDANINYLNKVIAELWGEGVGITESKLARKSGYIQLAKFSEALHYIHLEPKGKSIDIQGIHKIQILNYRINAIIASLSLSAKQQDQLNSDRLTVEEVVKNLDYCLKKSHLLDIKRINTEVHWSENEINSSNEGTLHHQLHLLLSLSSVLKTNFS